MEESIGSEQLSDDKLLFLRKQQSQFKEGSIAWLDYQQKISQISAERFLRYLNR